jgi:ubiquinone/menaquinone biosynthesis C-methylase UbiE
MEAEQIKTYMRDYRWNHNNAAAYDKHKKISNQQGWKSLLAPLLNEVPESAPVLEIGAGTGFVTSILAEAGYEVTAIDLSEAMLTQAEKNIAAQGLSHKVRLELGDCENLDLDDGTFDFVISRWLLWTLPRPDRGIREMARVCRPGGRVVLIDGQPVPQNRLQQFKSGLVDFLLTGRKPGWRGRVYRKVNQDLPRYDAGQVTSLFARLGLDPIESRTAIEKETEGTWRTALFGGGWTSYLVVARKPA